MRPKIEVVGWYDHDNCFSGDTIFITDRGKRSFADMVGKECKVMTTRGEYKQADIRCFGYQPLIKLELKRLNDIKVIFTTAEHNWFVWKKNNYIKLSTNKLIPGIQLVSLYGHGIDKTVKISPFGIAHGIVFGDGTVPIGNAPAQVTLCGEKDAELIKYFPLSDKKEVVGIGVKICDLPRTFKNFPSIDESKSYLFGWLAGYFAADGTVDKNGEVKISSSVRENLEFVQDICIKLGISTGNIREEQRKGLGKEISSLFTLPFIRYSLTSDFFLISEHKKRAIECGLDQKRQLPKWTVVSIEKTERIEKVYCAVVEDTHCFVLDGNILTSNCGDEAYKLAFRTLFPQYELYFTDIPGKLENPEATILGGGDVVSPDILRLLENTKNKHLLSTTLSQSVVLSDFKTTVVRDKASLVIAHDSGAPHTILLPDFTFCLSGNALRGKSIIRSFFKNQKTHDFYEKVVVVIVNGFLMGEHNSYYKHHAMFQHLTCELAEAIDNVNASFLFLPFGNGFPTDDRIANGWVASKCKFWQKNLVVFNPLAVQDTIDVIAGADAVISTRLHSSIFSCLCGTPFTDITHNHKNMSFLETNGLLDLSVNYRGIEHSSLIARLKFQLERGESVKTRLREISLEHKKMLYQFAKNVYII